MKIKILKDCKFNFAPSEPIMYFNKGEIHDLPENRAAFLFVNKYAEKVTNGEEKMHIDSENKMIDLEQTENKEFNQVKKKGRGRPPKN